jgi:hypothetical protein
MFLIEPDFQQVQVVLLGQFNPAIVQPGWLAKHEIIGESEALNARIEVIHPEVTVLHLAHVELMIEPGKCTLASRGIHFDVLRDFVLKTFGEFLFHTPISALGINSMIHFDCGSFEAREEFAKRLAPREPWGAWGEEIEGAPDGLEHGGLVSISMRQNNRRDGKKGFLIVRLEPSTRLPRTGIFMLINDHYSFDDAKDKDSAMAMEVIELNWEKSLQYSEFIANSVMKNFVEQFVEQHQ